MKTNLKKHLTYLSTVSIIYCFAAYLYLKPRLTPALTEKTRMIDAISLLIIPALFFVFVYHLLILFEAFTFLSELKSKVFLHSIFIVAVVLSLTTLLSDITILSDIGKEYPFWDINDQWNLLFLFSFFHLMVIIWSYFFNRSSVVSEKSNSYNVSKNDVLYLSIHQIGLICGIVGIISVFISTTNILQIPVRFIDYFFLLLSALSLFPFFITLVYWYLANRKTPLKERLDEKQIIDTAVSASFSLILLMFLLVVSAVLIAADIFVLPVLFWISLLFFISLSMFSTTVLLRNRS